MSKLFLSAIKLLLALIIFYFSFSTQFPAILGVEFCWCVFLWMRVVGWAMRMRIVLCFGMLVLAWCFNFLEGKFSYNGDASHNFEYREYCYQLSIAFSNVGFVLAVAGILLTTYIDYLRKPQVTAETEFQVQSERDQTKIWPPAPKGPK